MIRELHAQGFSITDISDKTGYDRKTVKKYLNLTTIPEPKQRAKKESMLDQYKDHIIKKLKLLSTNMLGVICNPHSRGFNLAF